MTKAKISSTSTVHHYIRTIFAAFFGAVALILISASILVVWANRTLTDTHTYVQTVAPLIGSPQLRDFVATKVTSQLLTSAPLPDLASNLLAPSQAAATPQELPGLLSPIIHASVVQILRSSQLQAAWKANNESAHAALVNQLNTNAPQIELSFGPLVDAVLAQMKQTKLAAVSDHINLQPSNAKVEIKGAPLEKIHMAYHWLKIAPGLIGLLAALFVGLSVWVSVHHMKTLRRMLITVGASSLVVAIIIAVPGFITLPASDPDGARLALALVGTLLHGLQVGCFVLGLGCVALAVASKVYERRRSLQA